MRIKVSPPPAPAGFSARCGDPRRASLTVETSYFWPEKNRKVPE